MELKNKIEEFYEDEIEKDFIGKENSDTSIDIEKELIKRQNFLFKVVNKNKNFWDILISIIAGVFSSLAAVILAIDSAENTIDGFGEIFNKVIDSGIFNFELLKILGKLIGGLFILLIFLAILVVLFMIFSAFTIMILKKITRYYNFKYEYDLYKYELKIIERIMKKKYSKYKMKYIKRYDRRLRLY